MNLPMAKTGPVTKSSEERAEKNVPDDGEIVGIEDPTEEEAMIEDPVDQDEENLKDEEEEEQTEDAETDTA